MESLDPNTPAGVPPPGVIPNFQAESRAESVIITSLTITAIMAVFVFLRLYSRMRFTKALGSDDYTCIAAAIGSIGFTTSVILSTEAGFGRHLWDYPISIFTDDYFSKIDAVQGIYSPLIFLVKLSLFLLYFRLFSPIRSTKILLYFGIATNAVFYAISFALIVYFCGPHEGRTLVESQSAYSCVVQARTLGTVQASFNIASDLYLLCIPLPIIWRLQMSSKRKLGVGAIFMTGFFAVICSILNLYYRILDGWTLDFTWAIPPVYITSVVEINVGIMCGCFPALPPILRSVHVFLTSKGSSSQTKVNSWRFLKVSPIGSDGGTPRKNRGARRARVTLGSRINGNGHFMTVRGLFSQPTDARSSADLTLRGEEPMIKTFIRSSHSEDLELGPMDRDIHVERMITSV
ncbi:hypothetical protein MMC11_007457 [Xylographa trunciseda]|nr:hypothetical protein [Xylographa trunciseda]